MRRSICLLALLALVAGCSEDPTNTLLAPDEPDATLTTTNVFVVSPVEGHPAVYCYRGSVDVSTQPYGSEVLACTGWITVYDNTSYFRFVWLKDGVVVYQPGRTTLNAGSRLYMSGGLPYRPGAGSWEVRACETDALSMTCNLLGSDTFVITKADPGFAFDLSGLPARSQGDPAFSVAEYVTTPSLGTITFATGAGSVGCSVTPEGMVTLTGAAVDPDACIIEASQAEAVNYLAAGPIAQSFSIAPASLEFAFDLATLPTRTYGDPDFSVVDFVTTNSGGALTFGTGGGSVGCSVTPGGVVSILGATGAGQCVLEVSVAADGDYPAAGPISASFSIEKAAGSVRITNLPGDAAYRNTFVPEYDRAGDGVATAASTTPEICTVSSETVTFADVGTCTLVASVAEGTNHLAATGEAQSFAIGPATIQLLVQPRPSSMIQYSDRLTWLRAVLLVEGTPAQEASGSVQFSIDGADVGDPVTVVNAAATLMGLPGAPAAPSFSVGAVFTSTDPRYTSAVGDPATVLVTPEDARVTYTGPEFVVASNVTATTVDVPLSATLQDITAVDPGADPDPGDIRNARVSFVDRDSGRALCSDLVPVLINGDATTGAVACTAPLDVGSDGATAYPVGIVVSGYYRRDSSDDNAMLTVAQPVEGMVTGGGHIVNVASAGEYAGAAGLKNNFGFNLKYNKKLTNLQGGVNIIVRTADGRVYQVKSNATTSLSINQPDPGMATFLGKANLTDITDPATPVAIAGNLELLLTLQDNGEPGSGDVIGITLRASSGALLFSSSWSGVETVQQSLHGGNLMVR